MEMTSCPRQIGMQYFVGRGEGVIRQFAGVLLLKRIQGFHQRFRIPQRREQAAGISKLCVFPAIAGITHSIPQQAKCCPRFFQVFARLVAPLLCTP